MDGNLLNLTGNLSAPTASVTTEKCVFNSVVSTPWLRCLLADLISLLEQYLTRPLIRANYVENHPTGNHWFLQPHCTGKQPRMDPNSHREGNVWSQKNGISANQDLVKHMAPFGYHPVQHTPGLWVHDNRNTIFSLVVDNFCVQYSSTKNADHFKIPSEPNISLQFLCKRKSTLESS